MKYPVLSRTACAELALQLVQGGDPSIDPRVSWVGQGEEIELGPIAAAADDILDRARLWSDKDRDRFEGRESIVLFEALNGVPVDILDDRGFWRFLGLRHFWEFIAWREAGPFAKGNYLTYVDAVTNTESVLPRMYLRAQAVGPAGAELAAAVPQGVDFWRSHVLRVRTGSAPALTRALAEKQVSNRLSTKPLRQAARRLNRYWANVVMHLYEDTEAKPIVDSVWSDP